MGFKKILKIGVAVILVVYLVRLMNWPAFGETLRGVDVKFFVLYVLFQTFAIFLSVKKWQVVAAVRHMPFELLPGTKAYLLGMFLNNFFPSVVGGDIYRGRWLGKKYENIGKALYTVFFERLQGLWLILVLVAPFTLVYGQVVQNSPFLFGVYLLFLLALAASLVFLLFASSQKFWLLLEKITGRAKQLLASLREDRQTHSWSRGLFATFLFILVGPFLSNWFLFLAFGAHVPAILFFFLILIGALLSSIPLSFGNLGVKEGAYALLFIPFGVTLEATIAVALVSRVIQFLFSLVALPSYLLRQEDSF